MSYVKTGNFVKIDGNNGQSTAIDPNVEYGENAQADYNKYLEDLKNESNNIKDMVDFKLTYSGSKEREKEALGMAALGASFRDFGGKFALKVDELNATFGNALSALTGQRVSASALDINKDGKVDIAENAAYIIVEDMASDKQPDKVTKSGKLELNAKDANGKITNNGVNNALVYLRYRNFEHTEQKRKELKQILDHFELNDLKDKCKDQKIRELVSKGINPVGPLGPMNESADISGLYPQESKPTDKQAEELIRLGINPVGLLGLINYDPRNSG